MFQGSASRAPAAARSAGAAIGRGVLMLLVFLYQCVSAVTPASCRHEPSCSHYALAALRGHGALRGGRLTLRRLARCHPWGTWGYDPVPEPDGHGCHGDHPHRRAEHGACRESRPAGAAHI